MAGTYAGGYHGTDHEFFGSSTGSVAASHDRLRRRAERNIQQASEGGRRRVVSADGKRVLSEGRKAEPRKPARRAAPTTGPGAGRAGRAPTTGPGVEVVGNPPVTAGPGVRQYQPMPLDLEGPAAGWAGAGPGTVGVGAVAGLGPGNHVLVGPGGVPFQWEKDEEVFPGVDLSVGLGKDQEQRTAYKQFGIWIQPSNLFTDAEHFENRVGDDGPMVWVNQTFTSIADYANTADIAAGRPRASLNLDVIGRGWNRNRRDGAGGTGW